MPVQPVQYLGNGGNDDRLINLTDQVIGQRRQLANMIEMEVGQQDHPDTPLLLEVEPRPNCAGIDQHTVINQKPAGTALNRTAASRH